MTNNSPTGNSETHHRALLTEGGGLHTDNKVVYGNILSILIVRTDF